MIHVTSEHRFWQIINTSKTLVVVDFSSSWLGPCRFINTVVHELSVRFPRTVFLKVDVDDLKTVSESCGVAVLPTFQFFHGGVKCDEMRGTDRTELEMRIQKHMAEMELLDGRSVDVGGNMLLKNGTGNMRHKLEVLTVTSEKQWKHLLQQNQKLSKALVVQFWATWCQPCIEIKPFFENLSVRFPAAVFACVDIDELESVTEAFDVTSLPCFKVFLDGKMVDELSGAIRSVLEDMVAKNCRRLACRSPVVIHEY